MKEQLSCYETIHIDMPATLKYLNVLGSSIAAMMAHVPDLHHPELSIYNVQLAAHEICTNIALHAYAHSTEIGRIQVSLVLNPQEKTLKIELFDEGEPFDVTMVSEPALDEGQIHGYGLFLAHNLMDAVTYQRLQNKNTWCLTKQL